MSYPTLAWFFFESFGHRRASLVLTVPAGPPLSRPGCRGLFARSREQIHTSSSDALLKTVHTHLASLIFWPSIDWGAFFSAPLCEGHCLATRPHLECMSPGVSNGSVFHNEVLSSPSRVRNWCRSCGNPPGKCRCPPSLSIQPLPSFSRCLPLETSTWS